MSILEFAFMQKALVGCTLIAAVAPLVGTFTVQRGQSLIGDGMGHMAFAGVGLAFLVGIDPVAGAIALTALAAVTLVRLTRAGLGGDLSLALIFYGGIATGYFFSARSGGGQSQILPLLFGSALNLSWGDVGIIAALASTVTLAIVALYRPLVALAFDEPAARVAGVPTQGLVMALTIVVALVVVAGMSSIGLLLISAMMVVPVAAAAQVASSYRGTLCTASAIGALSALVGLLIAFYGDAPPGAAIVLVALGCYVAARLARVVTRSATRAA
ncbi:MAG: metal ABC transporter permease [Euzebyales bacterium]|nr:metal ABC transporter permease [Euzebyales bacterium]MBA3621624.1 metal ABC transporter permease [Euzebyales bacterium]